MHRSRISRARALALTLSLALLFGVAACGSDDDTASSPGGDASDASGDTSSSSDGGGGRALEGLNVGLIMGGPKNDNGFYQAGFEGIERAAEEFGIEPTVVESVTPPEAEQIFRDLADAGNELIIGMGADFEDGGLTVAPDYPDVQFVVMNGRETLENLATYQLREGQSAFLATYLVSLLRPETTTFGLVGGIEIPPHLALRDGMGVALEQAGNGAELVASFTGSFTDVALAREAATAQINNGATVIVPWSGSAVDGAIAAASEADGVEVIAALVDRCGEPAIVASAVTDPGGLVFQIIEEFGSDDWDPSGSTAVGLETPDVGRVVPCVDVPPEVQAQFDEMLAALVADEVELPEGV